VFWEKSGNTSKYGGGVSITTEKFSMTGGTISGNTAQEVGGGVYSHNERSSFVKTGRTIDATNSATNGKVAWSVVNGKRDRTAGPNDNLNSSKNGRAGGWE
jgi:hypothetical protein